MITGRSAGATDSAPIVLVADDDEARVAKVRGALDRDGYRVIAAGDGAVALRQLAALGGEVVICEAALPDMDGLDVCRAIKRAPATAAVGVVLVLEGDDDVQRERAFQAGADDVVTEPIDPSLLRAMVRALVRIRGLTVKLNDLEGIVFTLARAIEDRDHSSTGLSEKVAHWAMQLGTAVGLPDEEL
ncbi:MAG TPA: response regulator, partial [Candidatus Dormibacteraeota bacterium]|nr:response regulator [Candidatus Dormibacteraeota bacterium]